MTQNTAVARRYANNTSTVPIDRRRWLGFAPGFAYMKMTPLGSNQQGEHIPQGTLIIFNPHVDKAADGDFKPLKLEYSGKSYSDAVAMCFQTGESDWGYRELEMLVPLDYNEVTGEDDADLYFNLVHPAFSLIGKVCPLGLEAPTEANYGVPMPCPTCRLEWLDSPELNTLIGGSMLDHELLDQVRERLITSYKKALDFAHFKLTATRGDIAKARAGKAGKPGYDDADDGFAKMVHEKAEHITQAELVSQQAEIQGAAQGRAFANAMQGVSTDPTAGMDNATKAKFYQWLAEQEAQEAEATPDVTHADAVIEDLPPIKIGEVVIHEGAEGIVKMKPGGKYVVEFADGNKTLTRSEITLKEVENAENNQ